MPSEIATWPGRTRPRPTTLHGLSPDHAQASAEGLTPCRSTQYRATGETTCPGRGQGRELGQEEWRGRLDGAGVPAPMPYVHDVRAAAVPVVDRREATGDQRGHERADEADAGGPRVAVGVRLREAPDLRAGEALEGGGARGLGGGAWPTEGRLDLAALLGGGRVHPHGRRRPRERRGQLHREGRGRVEALQDPLGVGVQVDGPVLLPGARYREDLGERKALPAQGFEEEIEGLDPHERRRVDDSRVLAAQDAVAGAVAGKRGVEGEARPADDAVRVEVDQDRAEALRARVEAEEETGHRAGLSRRCRGRSRSGRSRAAPGVR